MKSEVGDFMKVPRPSRRAAVGMNMTPMIDVVFLLIIFFLLSSHLARRENQMQMPLPVADSALAPYDENVDRITVNVAEDGNLVLAGRNVNAHELEERIRHEAQRVSREIELRIRADRKVPYENVSPVLLAAARSGVWNITFSVIHSGDR